MNTINYVARTLITTATVAVCAVIGLRRRGVRPGAGCLRLAVNGILGAVFAAGIGLLVGMPGLCLLIGARSLSRGDPGGAGLARTGPSLPQFYALAATVGAPFSAALGAGGSTTIGAGGSGGGG